MESCFLYNGCNPTALCLSRQTLSQEANTGDLPFEDWNLSDDRVYSESNGPDYTLVEQRTKTQTSWPLLTFPWERSIHNIAANQSRDDEQTSMVPTSPFNSFKSLKESATLPLLPIQSPAKVTSPEESLKSSPTSTPADVRLTQWDYNDDTTSIDPSKPLLSPIRFSPPPESKVQDLAPSGPSPKGNGPSTYLFYPPRNPADTTSQVSDSHRNIPRRQLFYGEPMHTPKPKSLHRTTGSIELRHRAGWKTEEDTCDSWFEGSLKTSKTGPWFSEPARRKPCLWLDLVDEGEIIGEAHATTVTSSPTKPQLISIPLRRATTTTAPPSAPPIHHEQTIPNFFPATPPETPVCSVDFGTSPHEASQRGRERLAFEKIKARPTWTAVTISTPDSTKTLRDIPPVSTPMARPDTPRPFHTPVPQLSELTIWLLTELEHSLSSHEREKLQLNSPVIQQLRLPSTQRRVPRSPPPTLPLSRFSTYKPPSSHPPSISVQTSNPPCTSSAPLLALRTIFPRAPISLLDALQATILALRHVSSIYLPSPSQSPSHSSPSYPLSPSPSPSQNTTLQSPDISFIPSKARAMLGLQPSTTSRPVRPTLPSSWLRPQVLSWGERVEELEAGLGREVGKLTGACLAGEVHGEGGNIEGPLVRALGEVVSLNEKIALRDVMGQKHNWDTGNGKDESKLEQ